METKILRTDATNIDKAGIKQAAAAIDAGRLVAFPTETVYGIACRAKSYSLARLDEVKGRSTDKSYTLHIAQSSDAFKYLPTIGLRVRKLIQNAWPGPLTVVFELSQEDINKQRSNLDEETFNNLYKNNAIGIRNPDNPIAVELLKYTKNPVVAPSANITGKPPAIDAQQVLAQLSGKIDLVLDGGPCKYKRSSTVVKMGNKGLKVLRDGVYSRVELEAFSQINFLFVCTGNTCRSPMAEGIFKKYLAEKLQCKVDELESIGYKVSSAGIMGIAGLPASAGSVSACAAMGIDIRAHRNRGLTKELVEESDFIYAMEKMHCDSVAALKPDIRKRCSLLADNKEVPDPIGCDQVSYNNCAKLIEKAVKKIVSELVL